MSKRPKILFYGYGNPGRRDDGLGVALAKRLEDAMIDGLNCEVNYQLNIEDAFEIAQYDAVIFADASIDATEPFEFRRIIPAGEIAFTTHSMTATSVLSLCEELYNKKPVSYMLGIRGYEWDAVESFSGRAAVNLEKAFDFAKKLIAQSSLEAMESAETACDGSLTR